VDAPYVGSFLEAEGGGRVHTFADIETGRVRLSLLDLADADLSPEQAAQLAVNLLRDRSMLVNGSG
jgi:hypothetical protein